MGIAIALLGYAVLHNSGLPAWAAVLAMCPVLFDSQQVTLEPFILPGVVYGFLLVLPVVLPLRRGKPAAGRCGLAGLLIVRGRQAGIRSR
jgi:hypothetical protein